MGGGRRVHGEVGANWMVSATGPFVIVAPSRHNEAP